MERSPMLRVLLQQIAGDTPEAAQENHRCVLLPIGCGKEVKMEDFRDEDSIKEYNVSGLCQSCQDDIFQVSAGETP